MNRDQYIEMIKSGQFNIDVSVLYEIYNKYKIKSAPVFDMNTFYQLIREYVQIVGTNGIIETLKTYYDSKFNITYLYDKNQKIINIY
jgi:hypothetical protein